jgi:hypothetical protein
LLQPHILELNVVRFLEPFGVRHEGLADDFGAFELFVECAVVVLETVVAESFLDDDLLAGAAQEVQLC